MQAFEMSLSQKKPIDVILKQLAYDNGQHGKEMIYSDVELEYNMQLIKKENLDIADDPEETKEEFR